MDTKTNQCVEQKALADLIRWIESQRAKNIEVKVKVFFGRYAKIIFINGKEVFRTKL